VTRGTPESKISRYANAISMPNHCPGKGILIDISS
jgi:hypothetical protein